MRWFKHLTRAHNDETITPLLATLGPEGYGFYWLICEIVAEPMDKSSRCSASHLLKVWSSLCHTKPEKMLRIARHLNELGLLVAETSGEGHQAMLTITVSKLLKYRDEYSSKSGHTPDTVPTKSRQTPDSVGTDTRARSESDTDTDTDTEADTEAEGNVPARPLNVPAKRNGPGAIGDEPWQEFRRLGTEYGWRYSDAEWDEARQFGWRPLDFSQQLSAVAHIRALMDAHDTGLVRAHPKNYLAKGMYVRAVGPPPKANGGGGIAEGIQRARELAAARKERINAGN